MYDKNSRAEIDKNPSIFLRTLTMIYSLISYLIGVVALVYLILFIADLLVPVSINRPSSYAPEISGFSAIAWNMGVVMLWGMQHTIMARPGFKKIWTRLVPVPIERSTYLIFVAGATALLVLFWVPMPALLWNASGTMLFPLLIGVYFFGWCITLFATFLINHFHLFGLQQAFHFLRRHQSKRETFRTPLLYKLVRHPMMTGVLIALWAVPVLTVGRLFFNLLMTAYIFVGLYFEEKTLSAELGHEYEQYMQTTPSVIPRFSAKQLSQGKATT